MNSKVAIIVVTYNRLELLREEIVSLRKQTYQNTQIIVVNNGSTDDTLAWLEKQADIYTITQGNLGGAGGFFTGMKYAAENGFDYVQVVGKRRKAHIDHVHDIAADSFVQIDESRLAGKDVVVVDDITTSCRTANAFIDRMVKAGARVRIAVFLAKTRSYRRSRNSYS